MLDKAGREKIDETTKRKEKNESELVCVCVCERERESLSSLLTC